MSDLIAEYTLLAASGRSLSREQTSGAFGAIMAGQVADEAIARFLSALADKGETVDEIVGAAEVLRRHVTPVPCTDPAAVDTCGTGGDGVSTFNVSTAAAIIAAGAGATVAKHGNRTNTRKSGSAEVMNALGVNVEAPPDTLARCLREVGIAFLHAAKLHPAMRFAAPARRQLARRTIFNLLGPLTNPAGVRRQVIGVASPDLLDKLAASLQQLAAVHALVVHGHGGLCDLSVTGPSLCMEVYGGTLQQRTVSPEDVGLPRGDIQALIVDSPAASAAAIRAVLAGEKGPRRDHAVLNAAAALVVAGRAASLREGVELAQTAIDSGAASSKLINLIEWSGGTE
jgi:anthranilate phosphoribosyltransferase